MERSKVDERLESGARLHFCGQRPVVRAFFHVPSADDRINITEGRIHAYEGPLDAGVPHRREEHHFLLVGAVVNAPHDVPRFEREIRQPEKSLSRPGENGVAPRDPFRNKEVARPAGDQGHEGKVPVGGTLKAFPSSLVEMERNRVCAAPLIVLGETLLYGVLRGPLQHRIHGGVYLKRPPRKNTFAVLVFHVLADRALEIGVREYAVVGSKPRALLQHGVFFLRVDKALFPHLVDHVELPHPGEPRMPPGRVPGGRLHNTCQQGGLRPVDLPDVLAEIDLGRRLYAVDPLPHIDVVEVDVQDFLLRQVHLQPVGEDGFAHLTHHALLGPQYERLDYLLRYGAAPLDDPPVDDIHKERPENALDLHAFVAEKVGVLGRQECLPHVLGHIGVRHRYLVVRHHYVDHLAAYAVDRADGLVGQVLQGLYGGYLGYEENIEADDRKDQGEGKEEKKVELNPFFQRYRLPPAGNLLPVTLASSISEHPVRLAFDPPRPFRLTPEKERPSL